MKCLSKPVAFAVFSACLALIGSSGVQQVEARAFRHDDATRVPTAKHILQREHYYAKRYHGVQVDEPNAPPVDDEGLVPEIPGAVPALDYESVVRRISSAAMRVFGSSPSSDDQVKDLVILDEVKFQAPVKTPMPASVKRSSKGKLCVVGMCGLSLFFASLGVTFAACFLVVYLLDRQLHRKKSLNDASKKSKKKSDDETEAKPVTKAPAAAVVKRSVVATTNNTSTSRKRSMNGIRARVLNYYQDVSDMSASMLHRRPPLGI